MMQFLSDSKFKILGLYCLVNAALCLVEFQLSGLLFALLGIGVWIAFSAFGRKEYRTALLIWLALQVLVIRAGDFSFDFALPLQLLAAFGGTSSNSELNEVYFNLVPLAFLYFFFFKSYIESKGG